MNEELKGKSMDIMFKSKQQVWITPSWVYEQLNKEFNFDFDPCPLNPSFDGLNVNWGKSNYVNPPYKEIVKWVKKGYEEYKKGNLVVFLLPVRSETKYFHNIILPNAEVRFVVGKLKFKAGNSKEDDESKFIPAPFSSMIVVFNPNKEIFNNLKSFKEEEQK